MRKTNRCRRQPPCIAVVGHSFDPRNNVLVVDLRAGRYAEHHDMSTGDDALRQGPRVLTVFIYLNDVCVTATTL